METDPTRRFSSRVEDYIRYRPGYPAAIISLLVRECGLRPGQAVADIGSGTGLFAELFLRFGCEVFGVEPNREMRLAGERLLAGFAQFHSIDGRAETTGLPDAAVDFVTSGQAFHWFDPAQTRAEFQRISKPPHRVILVWNERLVEGSFLEKYESLLQQYSPDYAKVDHRNVDAPAIDAFFSPGECRRAILANEQQLDLDGLLGRLHSSSYCPQPGTPAYDQLNAEITHLFHQTQRHGFIAFTYATRVYYGCLAPKSAHV